MKKIFFTAVLSVFVFAGMSQNSEIKSDEVQKTESIKPLKNYMGATFNLTGLVDNIGLRSIDDINGNESVMLRYYVKDDLVMRIGFGLNSSSKKFSSVDSLGSALQEYDSTYTQSDFYISPGIEHHMGASKRLDPYIGGRMAFGILGKRKSSSETVFTDTTGTGTRTLDSEMDGGFSFGLHAILGFNYFFTNQLAIGAEYVWGFNSITTGGDFSTVEIDTPISGSSTTTRTTGSARERDAGFVMSSTAGITLSYFFTRAKNVP